MMSIKKFIILNLALLSGTFCASHINKKKLLDSRSIATNNEIGEFSPEKEIYNSTEIGYSPRSLEKCPANDATYKSVPAGISREEYEFSQVRRSKVNDALLKFFEKTIGKDSGIDLKDMVTSKELTIGLSFSGGGYRSLFTGAGQLLGLDERAESNSPLSGILQASSYITGIYESNWLIGALIAHGFPVVSELFESSDKFNFQNGLVTPYGDDMSMNEQYWEKITNALNEKNSNKFPVSHIDVLANALSFQLLGEDKDENWNKFTLSEVANLDTFKNADMPYPLLTARLTMYNMQTGDDNIKLPLEMTPHRITSWSPSFNISINTHYFGSYQTDDSEFCFDRFDNLGFLLGVSSSRNTPFVQDLYMSSSNEDNSRLNTLSFKLSAYDTNAYLLLNTNKDNPLSMRDISPYFGKGLEKKWRTYQDTVSLESFAHPERNVDIIFLFDNTQDDDIEAPSFNSLENGISYLGEAFGSQFMQSFWNWSEPNNKALGRPGFFFGDTVNSPLIVYIPSLHYNENTKIPNNTQTSFTDEEVESLIINGLADVSLNSGDLMDDDWGICVACAMINHNLIKHETVKDKDTSKLSEKCVKCMEKYCLSKPGNTKAQSDDTTENDSFNDTPKEKKELSNEISEEEPSPGIWERTRCLFMGC